MGYYTDFILTVDPATEENSILDLTLVDNKSWESYIGHFYRGKTGTYYGSEWKWYEHHDDMLLLSSQYPNHAFTLDGDGEERGDRWVKYYKNGLSYKIDLNINPPPFDETVLGS